MIYVRYTDSPIGRITLSSDGDFVTGVVFEEERHPMRREGAVEQPVAVLIDAERQIQEYFGGWRKTFDLPLKPHGTKFQETVWMALREIAYGETSSYIGLARRLGNEKAVRAVGAANGRNPISILIPCHRVIGADGSLVGYGGGTSRKDFLLRLEGVSADTGKVRCPRSPEQLLRAN